ncbi:thymidine kinase [Tessaracoccus caeni]|uniref:thymidine kinase n=1 Tax=Tessaracoccus caeni TaxID=3031239 RepID=UPI0023DAE9BF|nr:thymidine kinase [Tessaracoccus caeni]MDF1487440.1 thymidine kinase [Tessaracoccus caeni]
MAKLYFRYGAMNSGKSTALLQAVYNYEERGRKVLVLKPAVDTKGNTTVVSRLGVAREVDALVHHDDDVTALLTPLLDGGDYSAVFIDEAQFLAREQVDQLMQVVVRHGLPVLAYGLRTDFLTQPFPGAQRLLELAHSIEELKTICRCGKKAVFNTRMVDGKVVFDGDQVSIEGQNVTYESRCAECYWAERSA